MILLQVFELIFLTTPTDVATSVKNLVENSEILCVKSNSKSAHSLGIYHSFSSISHISYCLMKHSAVIITLYLQFKLFSGRSALGLNLLVTDLTSSQVKNKYAKFARQSIRSFLFLLKILFDFLKSFTFRFRQYENCE